MTDKPAGERVLPDPAKPKPGHARYIFVIFWRGLALIVMIETHVINAYLPAVSRHTEFFFWLSFVNGLVAPAFLFASGFSLVLQAHRNWEAWLRFGPALRKQMRRLGFILLVAYYLHLPYFGISKFRASGTRILEDRVSSRCPPLHRDFASGRRSSDSC